MEPFNNSSEEKRTDTNECEGERVHSFILKFITDNYVFEPDHLLLINQQL